MRLLERVTLEPGKCGGRPCIRGMRIRVKDVFDMLAEGATPEEILADFPDLRVRLGNDVLQERQASVSRVHRMLRGSSSGFWGGWSEGVGRGGASLRDADPKPAESVG